MCVCLLRQKSKSIKTIDFHVHLKIIVIFIPKTFIFLLEIHSFILSNHLDGRAYKEQPYRQITKDAVNTIQARQLPLESTQENIFLIKKST